MSRLSDRLFELEGELDRNAGDDESAFFSRRVALREALTKWGDERWQEGHSDGRRDVWDARAAAAQAARDREAAEPDPGGPADTGGRP